MGQVTLNHLRVGLDALWSCLRGRSRCNWSVLTTEDVRKVFGITLEDNPSEIDYFLAMAEVWRRKDRDGDWTFDFGPRLDRRVSCHLVFSCARLDCRASWIYQNFDSIDESGFPVRDFEEGPPVSGRFEVGVEFNPGKAFTLPGNVRPPPETLRPLRRSLDPYAMPRLYLEDQPPQDEEFALKEWLIQVAVFARKGGHMREDNQTDSDLAVLFRSYAERVIPPPKQKGVDPHAWESAVNNVYMRLIHRANYKKGICAGLETARSFRAYIRRAIMFGMRPGRSRSCANKGALASCPSITEAAELLGVSFSTIWRHMRAAGRWSKWCPDAWKHVEAEIRCDKEWQIAERYLLDKGKSAAAARKSVYRARKAGKSPLDLLS